MSGDLELDDPEAIVERALARLRSLRYTVDNADSTIRAIISAIVHEVIGAVSDALPRLDELEHAPTALLVLAAAEELERRERGEIREIETPCRECFGRGWTSGGNHHLVNGRVHYGRVTCRHCAGSGRCVECLRR